tara:strand:- start:2401 stop:3804 length:1404 start_codon:yes stop_codon:yes gene_type:complete
VNTFKHYLQLFLESWRQRRALTPERRSQEELDFLPAALQIQEQPPSPHGRILGWSLMALFAIGVVWACVGEVDIVAVAEGKIISSGRSKSIQPLEKGVIKAVLVKEGQTVRAGQALVELDQTLSRAEQTRLTQQLRFIERNLARKRAMATALQSNSDKPSLKLDHDKFSIDERLAQQSLLQQEWHDYRSQVATVVSQVEERKASLLANKALVTQLQKTLPLVDRQANALKQLFEKQLAPEMDYLTLEQSRIEQQQSLSNYQALAFQYRASIETAQQQLNAIRAEATASTLSELNELTQQFNELTQQLAKADDINQKQTLYAPVDGTVHQLSVFTVGGVVMEAQELMQVVPYDDFLEVEAVLENKDVGFVKRGQRAEVKVHAFPFTKYGVIDSEVIDITSDAVVDEQRGLVYKLRVKMDESELLVNGDRVELIPGMLVSAEVKTGKRQLIEYVMAPLLRYSQESVRER